MIKNKNPGKMSSSKTVRSIKPDQGDAISEEPPPLNQSLTGLYNNQKLYVPDLLQRRD
jgi:hypothetical protein